MNARMPPPDGALVGRSVPHESAHLHVSGRATYIDDLPESAGTLHAAPGLSACARGRIRSLDLSAVLGDPGALEEPVATPRSVRAAVGKPGVESLIGRAVLQRTIRMRTNEFDCACEEICCAPQRTRCPASRLTTPMKRSTSSQVL